MKNCPQCLGTFPNDFTHCPRDGTQLIMRTDWFEGALVCDKYRILGQIGVGGMATVYKAEHIHFGEIRALKVMNAELVDQAFTKRLMQEAIVTRRLQHPNAVRVDDFERAEDGRPFIVMEFIEGRGLKETMERHGPMSVAIVCTISKQVAAALDAAHRLGLVHRDIKPANIILVKTQQGVQAKVLDFGIAQVKDARPANLTGTGFVVGTPSYMSPEQAMGTRGEGLDGRSDIYSLGILMYQMLAGELPLKASSEQEMVLAQIQTAPTRIECLRADLPIPIVDLVMQCLSKRREDRPASASALIAAIEHCEELARRAEEDRIAGERAAQVERERAEAARRAEEDRIASEQAAQAQGQRAELGHRPKEHRIAGKQAKEKPVGRKELEAIQRPNKREVAWQEWERTRDLENE